MENCKTECLKFIDFRALGILLFRYFFITYLKYLFILLVNIFFFFAEFYVPWVSPVVFWLLLFIFFKFCYLEITRELFFLMHPLVIFHK